MVTYAIPSTSHRVKPGGSARRRRIYSYSMIGRARRPSGSIQAWSVETCTNTPRHARTRNGHQPKGAVCVDMRFFPCNMHAKENTHVKLVANKTDMLTVNMHVHILQAENLFSQTNISRIMNNVVLITTLALPGPPLTVQSAEYR